jgi:hypothetical protein
MLNKRNRFAVQGARSTAVLRFIGEHEEQLVAAVKYLAEINRTVDLDTENIGVALRAPLPGGVQSE